MLATATSQDDSATLLVVDDDRDIRMLLANSLGSRGYKVETASSTRDMDRILALEVGAGHYLPKPCSPREILATVRAALRKRGAIATNESGDVYVFEGWRIDLGSHELFDPNGVLVGLTDGEFAVLRVFIE